MSLRDLNQSSNSPRGNESVKLILQIPLKDSNRMGFEPTVGVDTFSMIFSEIKYGRKRLERLQYSYPNFYFLTKLN